MSGLERDKDIFKISKIFVQKVLQKKKSFHLKEKLV